MRVLGGVFAQGNLYVNGAARIVSNTVSTSNTTGALQIGGGVGIVGNAYIGGLVSVTGNVTGGNLNAGGLSLSSNVVSAINSTSNITTTANIAGNYFIGNGAALTGIIAEAGAAITNGTSNVVVSASSNITANVAGSAIATFATTGVFVTGVVSATGNVSGNRFLGNGSQLTGVVTSVGTGTGLTGGPVTSTGTISIDSTVVTLDGVQILTNKRITPRVSTPVVAGTYEINTDSFDMVVITGQNVNITDVTTTGTPTNGQKLWFSVTGTATRTILFNSANFESSTVTLPTTTVSTNRLDVGFVWNVATGKWRCVAQA
jgi:hypothetical protein